MIFIVEEDRVYVTPNNDGNPYEDGIWVTIELAKRLLDCQNKKCLIDKVKKEECIEGITCKYDD